MSRLRFVAISRNGDAPIEVDGALLPRVVELDVVSLDFFMVASVADTGGENLGAADGNVFLVYVPP